MKLKTLRNTYLTPVSSYLSLSLAFLRGYNLEVKKSLSSLPSRLSYVSSHKCPWPSCYRHAQIYSLQLPSATPPPHTKSEPQFLAPPNSDNLIVTNTECSKLCFSEHKNKKLFKFKKVLETVNYIPFLEIHSIHIKHFEKFIG